MTILQAEDTVQDMLMKMSEGNPGALTVLMEILNQTESIDPDNALGGFGPMLMLDTYGLYGSNIWMLYKDVCGQDLATMLAVLRAVQLGIIRESELIHAVNNYGDGIDLDDVLSEVQERLPNFRLSSESGS